MKARLIDRSQKQFQVRELANRQMALVEQNKELKEENDRWVVMLVISFFLFLFRIFSLCAWWSVPRSEIPSEFKIAPLINQDVGARPSFVSNPHNLCARSPTKPPPHPHKKRNINPHPTFSPIIIIILILRIKTLVEPCQVSTPTLFSTQSCMHWQMLSIRH